MEYRRFDWLTVTTTGLCSFTVTLMTRPKSYQDFESGAPAPKHTYHGRAYNKSTPWFIYLMTGLQIGVMGLEYYMNGREFEPFSVNPLIGPSEDVLLALGAKSGPLMYEGQVWRFITPIFLHGGLIHLFFNLSMQTGTGAALERQYGFIRIAAVYFFAGFGGNLASVIFLPNVTSVGASSSLFGLLGVEMANIIQNWGNLRSPVKETCSMIFSVVFALAVGLFPLVDNFAHLGGFVFGFFATPLLIPLKGESGLLEKGWKCGLAMGGVAALFALITTGMTLFYAQVQGASWCDWCWRVNCLPIEGVIDCSSYTGEETGNSTLATW